MGKGVTGNGSMMNKVEGGDVLLHANECKLTSTATGLDAPNARAILIKTDTYLLLIRLSRRLEGVSERWLGMKPQSAFDRAASGCGSPSLPSSYDNHPNFHHEQDFFSNDGVISFLSSNSIRRILLLCDKNLGERKIYCPSDEDGHCHVDGE